MGQKTVKPFDGQGKHTVFDNFILDYIMPKVKPNAWKCLCFIIRKTVGWHKASDEISFSQIKAGTGIGSYETVTDALKQLEKDGYILVKRYDGQWESNRYALNTTLEIVVEPTTKTVVEEWPTTETVIDTTTEIVVEPTTKTVDTKQIETKETKGVASATQAAEDFDNIFPPKEKSLIDQVRSGDPEQIAHAQMMALGLAAKQQAGNGVEQIRLVGWKVKSSRIEAVVGNFIEATKLPVPPTKTERSQWLAGASDHLDEFGLVGLCELYQAAWKEYLPAIRKGEIDITHPAALTKKMRAIQQRSLVSLPDSNGHGECFFTDPATGEVIRW